MLPKELVRYRIEADHIYPKYITRKQGDFYLRIAEDLIRIYEEHFGKIRGELDETLLAYEGERLNYKILRGLANILDKDIEMRTHQEKNYPTYRDEFFTHAEKFRPITRVRDIIHDNTKEKVISQLNPPVPAKSLVHDLYGDLRENQLIAGWIRPISPAVLLRQYNLALAQGILYRAEKMVVTLRDSFKIVFKYMKLARLMHMISPLHPGYQIIIDGPLSLFEHTIKYGIQLARFLPGLLLACEWEMQARIRLKEGYKTFSLDHRCGLHSHYRDDNPFDSSVEEAFFKKFSKKFPEWRIEREADLIDLADTIFIPDFTLYSPSGQKFLMEIVGFWTPEYLSKKIDKIDRANRTDLLIAVDEHLNCSREAFKGRVIFYKNRVDVEEVMRNISG